MVLQLDFHNDGVNNKCDLLGPVGFIVQLSMAMVSFLVLVYKRLIEDPKREWKIFLLDTSKQVFSAGSAHVLNVTLAIIMSSRTDEDSCVWYLVTIILDCTVGLLLTCIMISYIDKLFSRLGKENYKSGNYFSQQTEIIKVPSSKFDSPEVSEEIIYVDIDYGAWSLQLLIWCTIVITTKGILFVIQTRISHPLRAIGEFLLSWSNFNMTLKLIIVMMIVPLIFNGLQFWIQDNFLKKKEFIKDKDIYAKNLFFAENKVAFKRLGSLNVEPRLSAHISTLYSEHLPDKGAFVLGAGGRGSVIPISRDTRSKSY